MPVFVLANQKWAAVSAPMPPLTLNRKLSTDPFHDSALRLVVKSVKSGVSSMEFKVRQPHTFDCGSATLLQAGTSVTRDI